MEIGKYYRCTTNCNWWGGGASKGTVVRVDSEKYEQGNTFQPSTTCYTCTPLGPEYPQVAGVVYRINIDSHIESNWEEITEDEMLSITNLQAPCKGCIHTTDTEDFACRGCSRGGDPHGDDCYISQDEFEMIKMLAEVGSGIENSKSMKFHKLCKKIQKKYKK